MTVSNVSRRISYSGNGATKTFSVPFQFFELAVYVDGVLKNYGPDYAVSQTTPGTDGFVNFGVAPAPGKPVVILGSTDPVQGTDLVDNDSAPAETYEAALDRLTMIGQELGSAARRALRAPLASDEIPEMDFKANPEAFLVTDENGDPKLAPLYGMSSPLTPIIGQAQVSAAAAALSAANAATSESNAATSETNAAASESAANVSAMAAASSAASVNLPASLTGHELEVLRVKSDASGYELAAVAGGVTSYNDLTDKPTLGTVAPLDKDTDGALAANSDSRVPSQKATKTYADTKMPLSYLDTDVTLAANSDAKLASQKAAKSYADTKVPSTYIDTDGALTANSDTKLASQKATKTYIDGMIGLLSGALVFKGSWDASAGTFPGSGSAKRGWFYKVSVAGTVNGQAFDVGDDVYAVVNNASASTYASNWQIVQGTITSAEVVAALASSALAYSKIQNVSATSRVLGRISAGAGVIEELTGTNLKTILSLVVADVSGAAPLASPTFTGTPAAPTASSRANSTQLATAAYADAQVDKSTISVVKTASATLALADVGKTYRMNVASGNNLTVPANASVAIPVDAYFNVEQYGAGLTTIVADTGVTILSRNGLKMGGQYAMATLHKIGTNEWMLGGDVST